MSNKDSLGDRIKSYEDAYRIYLPDRLPIIIRLDGRSFHQYTSSCQRPFDANLVSCMDDTAKYLVSNISGAKLAYIQSDEISIVIYSPEFNSEGWFGNNLQKLISVSASMASTCFTSLSHRIFGKTKIAIFDARAFIVPQHEVVNVLEWRQSDCLRNSVQMLARSLYSHKECSNKNNSQLQEMCFQQGVNWNNLPTSQKRGRCIIKELREVQSKNKKTGDNVVTCRPVWTLDNEIPIFHENRDYVLARVGIKEL